MTEYPFSEADLRAAAFAVSESMLTSLPKPDEIEHEFSDGFLKKMDALIAKDRRQRQRQAIARRAAMIALALLVSIGAWLAVDTEARAAFIQWIKEIYENYTVYRFYDRADEEILPDFTLSWLPEGFLLTSTETNQSGHFEIYESNSAEEEIFFMYHLVQSGFTPAIVYDYDGQDLQEVVMVHGSAADYYPADENSIENVLIWIDENQGVWFELSSSLPKETILRIAESVS